MPSSAGKLLCVVFAVPRGEHDSRLCPGRCCLNSFDTLHPFLVLRHGDPRILATALGVQPVIPAKFVSIHLLFRAPTRVLHVPRSFAFPVFLPISQQLLYLTRCYDWSLIY